MNDFKLKLLIKVIIISFFIQLIICLNNSDEDPDSSDDYSDDFTVNSNKTEDIEREGIDEGSGDDEEDDEDYDEGEGECTALELVKNLNISEFLPDDYEQLKNEPWVKTVPHFDDTWGRFLRAFKWEHKVYRIKDVKEVLNYLIGIAYEMSYDFNLEPDCAVALSQLLRAILNEEIWAFKCEYHGNFHPKQLR